MKIHNETGEGEKQVNSSYVCYLLQANGNLF